MCYNNNGDNMKRIFILIFVLLLTGCFNKNELMVCTSNISNAKQNYKSNITYNVYHKNNIVTKVTIDEVYTSDSLDMITYFNESRSAIYDNYNKLYDGYSYKIQKSNNRLEINTTIDYSKVNVKKMVRKKIIDKDYVDNYYNLTRLGAKTMYENMGATCK